MTRAGQIAAEFFEVMNSRDIERLRDFLEEDVRFFFPKTQPLIGKDRVFKFFQLLFRRFPELEFSVRRVVAEEGRAAVHWTNRGTNRKNEPYENEGVTLFDFEAEKIVFLSDFFKDTGKF